MGGNDVLGDSSSTGKARHLSSLKDKYDVSGSPRSAESNLQNIASHKPNLPDLLQPLAGLSEETSFKWPLIGEVRLDDFWALAKKVWVYTVGISLIFLILVAFGLLDAFIPTEIISKETLVEILNQIATTGLTVICLYLHPERCAHVHMLYRWDSTDIQRLREVYSKNGTKKPHERIHFLVILIMLQLNCFGQYVLFLLNIVYTAKERPPVYVLSSLGIALGGVIGAGVYKNHSPLGRDYEVAA